MKKKGLLSLILLAGSIALTSCSEAQVNNIINTAFENANVQELLTASGEATVTVDTNNGKVTVDVVLPVTKTEEIVVLPEAPAEVVEEVKAELTIEETVEEVVEEVKEELKTETPVSIGGGRSFYSAPSTPAKVEEPAEQPVAGIENLTETVTEEAKAEVEGAAIVTAVSAPAEELTETVTEDPVIEQQDVVEEEIAESEVEEIEIEAITEQQTEQEVVNTPVEETTTEEVVNEPVNEQVEESELVEEPVDAVIEEVIESEELPIEEIQEEVEEPQIEEETVELKASPLTEERKTSGVNTIYIDYTLNEDEQTYTASICANYNATIQLIMFPKVSQYNIEFDSSIDPTKVTKIVLAEGSYSVVALYWYPNVKYLEVADEVYFLSAGFTQTFIPEIYLEGSIPVIENGALWFGGKEATIYVDTTEKVNVPSTIQGNEVKVYNNVTALGSVINLTVDEYLTKLTNNTLTIARTLVDNCSSDVERSLLLYPYSSLAEYAEIKAFTLDLTKDCITEEEKALTIFSWVQTNIEFDNNYGMYSTYEAFVNRRGVCNQFATLTHDMFSAVGIYSFYISGSKDAIAEKYEQGYTLSQVINFKKQIGKYSHAFLVARVNNEWAFYDPTTTYKELNLNLFNMNAEKLQSISWTPFNLELINCLPEDVAETTLSSANFYMKDSKVYWYNIEADGYQNNACNYTMSYNTLSFSAVTNTTFSGAYYSLGNYSAEFAEVVVSGIYTKTSLKNFNLNTCKIASMSGRLLSTTDVINYWLDTFTVTEINAVLGNSPLTLVTDGLYIVTDTLNTKVYDIDTSYFAE